MLRRKRPEDYDYQGTVQVKKTPKKFLNIEKEIRTSVHLRANVKECNLYQVLLPQRNSCLFATVVY